MKHSVGFSMKMVANLGRVLLVLWFAGLMSAITPVPALAADPAIVIQTNASVNEYRTQLEAVQETLKQKILTPEQLGDQRKILDSLRGKVQDATTLLAVPMNVLQNRIDVLGPEPKAGTTEPPAIAQKRAALTSEMAVYKQARSGLDLLQTDIQTAILSITDRLRDQFLGRIFEPARSVLNYTLWVDGWISGLVVVSRLQSRAEEWVIDAVSGQSGWSALAGFIVLMGLICFAAIAIFLRVKHYMTRHQSSAPSDLARLFRVASRPAVLLLLVWATGLVVSRVGAQFSAFSGTASDFAATFFAFLGRFSVNYMFLNSLIAPDMPKYRMVAVSDKQASLLNRGVILLSVVFGLRGAFLEIKQFVLIPMPFVVCSDALLSIALCALLYRALRIMDPPEVAIEYKAHPERHFLGWLSYMRLPVLAVIAVSVIALVAGYIAFSATLSRQSVSTLIIIAMLALAHRLVDAFIDTQLGPTKPVGRYLHTAVYISDSGLEQLKAMLRTVSDILTFLIGVVALLAQWTLTWIDLPSFFSAMLGSVVVGNLNISPSAILIGMTMLVAGILAARIFSRWLDRRVLSVVHIDPGVRDSIDKATTYIGILIAAALSLAVAGISFSSLALVFGALGVGIGFGLQSIVNNFVSGLILLAERPIKVGDWVVLSAGEGIVQKINVRSTKIQTFDSCTIIVPNSSLITEAVRNWTYGSFFSRLHIKITTGAQADPATVIRLLNEAVREHDKVLQDPEPAIILADITADGLVFDISATVANVFSGGGVASDIRVKIYEKFRENHILFAIAANPADPWAPPAPPPATATPQALAAPAETASPAPNLPTKPVSAT